MEESDESISEGSDPSSGSGDSDSHPLVGVVDEDGARRRLFLDPMLTDPGITSKE